MTIALDVVQTNLVNSLRRSAQQRAVTSRSNYCSSATPETANIKNTWNTQAMEALYCQLLLTVLVPFSAAVFVTPQERRSTELESQLAELQQQLEAAQSSRSVTQEALDQARSLFKRKMEGAARELAELTQRVALAAG
jgi:hypothetical protein